MIYVNYLRDKAGARPLYNLLISNSDVHVMRQLLLFKKFIMHKISSFKARLLYKLNDVSIANNPLKLKKQKQQNFTHVRKELWIAMEEELSSKKYDHFRIFWKLEQSKLRQESCVESLNSHLNGLYSKLGSRVLEENLENTYLGCLLLPRNCDQRRNLVYKAPQLFGKQEKYLGVSRKYKKHKNRVNGLLSRYINYVAIGLFSLLYETPLDYYTS